MAELDFVFELGQLKREKRSGWWIAKVPNPESVAEHSFRAAVIAYIIAEGEGKTNASDYSLAALLHDSCETRLGDRHKISQKYLKKGGSEKKARSEQLALLPARLRRAILSLPDDAIVRDADLLECAVQAKEYLDCGYRDAKGWMKRAGMGLKTKTAKRLYAELKRTDSGKWWHGLKI
ncbi:HD domain protein [Candidatus Norongarragalina meridionalis]|nr:HD domain protein [Candidatus Norongarragalina meridionalis]